MSDRPTVAAIQAAVCCAFDIEHAEMCSGRGRDTTRPRQVAMYLANMLTGKSLRVIGRHFDDREPGTVIAAVRRVPLLMAADPVFALRVTAIEQRLRKPEPVEHF